MKLDDLKVGDHILERQMNARVKEVLAIESEAILTRPSFMLGPQRWIKVTNLHRYQKVSRTALYISI